MKHNGEWYLNPAIPAARTYIASLAAELASRYNIDGIHLDYIRYPENNARFPDDKQFRATGRSKSNKADWRTDNISKLVKEVADSARAHNPYILMSAATLGRYREIPGRKVSGWTCRGAVFQDPLAWFRQGSVDFIVPMMYHDGDLFYPFLNDWRALFGDYPVIPGLAAYRIAEKKSRWSVETIAQQMNAIEQTGCAGVAFYRESNIRPFIKGMPELFEQHFPRRSVPSPFTKRVLPFLRNPPFCAPFCREMNYISAGPFLTLTRCGTTFSLIFMMQKAAPVRTHSSTHRSTQTNVWYLYTYFPKTPPYISVWKPLPPSASSDVPPRPFY